MREGICQWCGGPFRIGNGKAWRKTYCCADCACKASKDKVLYRKGLTDSVMALRYFKKMLRCIKKRPGRMWRSLSMVQWDQLIELSDLWEHSGGELAKANEVIQAILSVPANQTLVREGLLWSRVEELTGYKRYKRYKKRT